MKNSKDTKKDGQNLILKDITEDCLLSKIHIHIWNNFPSLRGCCWHIANERKTTAKEGAVFKAKGVVSGVPDYVINANGWTYYFELKSKIGILSEAQKKVHESLRNQGFEVFIIRDFEQFLTIFNEKIIAKHAL